MLKRLRLYLTLGVIINPLPNNILDGQVIDAVPVMGNFNWIVSQVNSNISAGLPANISNIPTFVAPGSTGGSANAITLTPSPAISAYAAGQRFSFIPNNQNTGATTVATSGLAARAVTYADGTALTGGELQPGATYDIEDNGVSYTLMNSSQPSGLFAWTPVVTFGGGNTGITYSVQFGNYVKIGRMVFYSFNLSLSSKGVSTGTLAIGGLPYKVNTAWPGGFTCPMPLATFNTTFAAGYCVSDFIGNTITMNIVNVASGAGLALLADTNCTNTTGLAGSGMYPV